MRGKTLLVIAHRLSTIADADQIIVVNHGKIEATGTQSELLVSKVLEYVQGIAEVKNFDLTYDSATQVRGAALQ